MSSMGFLGPCYFECGRWASSMGVAWELVRLTESQAPLRPAESESAF